MKISSAIKPISAKLKYKKMFFFVFPGSQVRLGWVGFGSVQFGDKGICQSTQYEFQIKNIDFFKSETISQ
jgi:hypothetical protein